MNFKAQRGRASLYALAMMFAVSLVSIASVGTTVAHAAVVNSISVQGNQRLDDDTVRSYVTIRPGRNYTSFDTDESVRRLFATGLFSDVRISRSGSRLIVQVEENPTINLVRFTGNDKVKDERLQSIVQSETLGIFSQEKLDSDVNRVREVVRRSGRASATVVADVTALENNRVNINFIIDEGARTKISDINFVGNSAFSDGRLEEVISHNESNLLSWLKNDDIFDPDRLRADEERLRQFYFNRGYADFRVLSANGEFSPENNSYVITFTVEEGDRYTFGNVSIDNSLQFVDDALLQSQLRVRSGAVYSAKKVERTLVEMTNAIANSGYAFGEVTPQGERNFENRTIDVTFFVDEGPRTYIERIDIIGNSRTRGYVIRREFDVSEGDAYNRVLVDRAKRRLDALGFFKTVKITTRPGSAPDRVVLVVDVQDQPTGELSIGGGFSSGAGAVAEVSLAEKNFLGRGQYLKLTGGFGSDTQRYELSFTEPYFLGQRIAAGFDIKRETVDPDVGDGILYSNDITSIRLRATAPITDELKATVFYDYSNEQVETLDRNSAAFFDPFNNETYVKSALGYNLVYADLDSFKNPRQGIYGKFTQEFAGVGGDAEFVKTTGRAIGYQLLSEDLDVVLFGLAEGGHIEGLDGDVRFVDQFFRGGRSIRGFDDTRGYGPRNLATGESLGGTSYFNVTAEVQFPLPILPRAYGLRGAVFADAGTLFNTEAILPPGAILADESSIRASIGGSILWDSPFGPLRADLAHAIVKEDFDNEQVFHFGVSTKF